MQRALTIRVWSLLLPWVLLAGPLFPQQVPNTAKDILSRPAVKEKKEKEKPAAGKKNAVEDALALPKGMVFEDLRKDQQAAYTKMKDEYKPKLQEVLDRKDKASKEQDKTKAAQEFLKLRKEVGAKIAAILKQPNPEAVKMMQNAAKRAYSQPPRGQHNNKGHHR